MLQEQFDEQFESFRREVERVSGTPFVSFGEGLPYTWESYKPVVRTHALKILGASSWNSNEVGSGTILNRVIRAIEINEVHPTLRNNLVRWENRYGHASRSHRQLLDARDDSEARTAFEGLLLQFYQGSVNPEEAFEQLVELVGKRYDLVAYLYYLQDAERFMPIAPQTFDDAFRLLSIPLETSGKCSWDNYERYNASLSDIQVRLAAKGLADVILLDAHSFCWMLVRLPNQDAGESAETATTRSSRSEKKDPGRHLAGMELSIAEMRSSVLGAVGQSGTVEERHKKTKLLSMSIPALDEYIRQLLVRQEYLCALTGIKLQWQGQQDRQVYASLDRINSDGHYEDGNLQVVCRFINRWKSDTPDEEFQRLLALVRHERDGM